MKLEQVRSVSGAMITTDGGVRRAIGNARHQVGDWVWVDSGCVFGHERKEGKPPAVVPEQKVFIEFLSSENGIYRLINPATGATVGSYSLPADWNTAYVIYGDGVVAFFDIYDQLGTIRVITHRGAERTAYTINLPNEVTPAAYEGYFDSNGDLIWAVLLYQSSTCLCKIIQGKNNVITSLCDNSSEFATLCADYKALVLPDIIARYAQIAVSIAYYKIGISNPTVISVDDTMLTLDTPAAVETYRPGVMLTPENMSVVASLTKIDLWNEAVVVSFKPEFILNNTAWDYLILSANIAKNSHTHAVYAEYIEQGLISGNTLLNIGLHRVNVEYQRLVKFTKTAATLFDVGVGIVIVQKNSDIPYTSYYYPTTAYLNSASYQVCSWTFRYELGNSGYQLETDYNHSQISLRTEGWSMDITDFVYAVKIDTKPFLAETAGKIYFYDTQEQALYVIDKTQKSYRLLRYVQLYNLTMPVIKLKKIKFGHLFGS